MSYIDDLRNLRSKRIMEPTNIDMSVLEDAIEHVRLGSSARNEQKLRFVLINDERVTEIFKHTNLITKHQVKLENKPSAFIAIGLEAKPIQGVLLGMDLGISVQIIREYLNTVNLNSVCVYDFKRNEIKEILTDSNLNFECLIAIGKSNQIVNIEDSNELVENYYNDKNEYTVRKLISKKLIR